jgi:WD40 repeat protein
VVNLVAVGPGLLVPIVCPPNRDTLLALNPRGTRLAVSCERSDSVQVLDPRSGREVTRCAGFQRVSGIEFHSTEVLLVAASDGCFRCDLRRGGREVLSSESGLTRTAVSPNGRVVAIGVHGGIDLYDVRKGQVLRRLGTGFLYRPIGTRAAFSASGRYVAAELSDDYYRPILVGVWDVHNGRRQRVFDAEAHALAFREDTLALAVADDHGRIHLYEPDQGEEPAMQCQVNQPWMGVCGCALQFRDGGRTLAVLLGNGAFAQVEADTGRVLRRRPPPAESRPFAAVASADWSLFAGASEDGVVVWPGDRAAPGTSLSPEQR